MNVHPSGSWIVKRAAMVSENQLYSEQRELEAQLLDEPANESIKNQLRENLKHQDIIFSSNPEQSNLFVKNIGNILGDIVKGGATMATKNIDYRTQLLKGKEGGENGGEPKPGLTYDIGVNYPTSFKTQADVVFQDVLPTVDLVGAEKNGKNVLSILKSKDDERVYDKTFDSDINNPYYVNPNALFDRDNVASAELYGAFDKATELEVEKEINAGNKINYKQLDDEINSDLNARWNNFVHASVNIEQDIDGELIDSKEIRYDIKNLYYSEPKTANEIKIQKSILNKLINKYKNEYGVEDNSTLSGSLKHAVFSYVVFKQGGGDAIEKYYSIRGDKYEDLKTQNMNIPIMMSNIPKGYTEKGLFMIKKGKQSGYTDIVNSVLSDSQSIIYESDMEIAKSRPILSVKNFSGITPLPVGTMGNLYQFIDDVGKKYFISPSKANQKELSKKVYSQYYDAATSMGKPTADNIADADMIKVLMKSTNPLNQKYIATIQAIDLAYPNGGDMVIPVTSKVNDKFTTKKLIVHKQVLPIAAGTTYNYVVDGVGSASTINDLILNVILKYYTLQ